MKENNTNLALNFSRTGYKDYKAARFLINNELYIQGVTLASSAIEKFLKVILTSNGLKKPVHLDRVKDLKKAFEKIDKNIVDSLDPSFIEILGDAYKLRYYDNFKGEISFGFIVTQLLAELDWAVNFLDSKIIFKNDKNGDLIMSPYQTGVNEKDPILFEKNYLLNDKIEKKDAMEKGGPIYALMVEENGMEREMKGGEFSVEKYSGKIVTIKEHHFK